MKKTLSQIFDEATPEELTALSPEEIPLEKERRDTIFAAVRAKTGLSPKKKRLYWPQIAAAAACVCVLVGALAHWKPDKPVDDDVIIGYEPQTIDMLLAREDLRDILWASDDRIGADDTDEVLSAAWSIWNGIPVSDELRAYATLDTDAMLAIRIARRDGNDAKLADYIYDGQTYRQICQARDEAHERVLALQTAQDIVGSYDIYRSTEDEPQFWEKLAYNLEDALYDEIKQTYYDGNRFDTDALAADIAAAQTEQTRLEARMRACRRAYDSGQASLNDLHGYAVYQNDGALVVLVPCNALSDFAADVLTSYDEETLSGIYFALATPAYLGIDLPDRPDVDTPTILPDTDDVP